jgi:hypothetical protein
MESAFQKHGAVGRIFRTRLDGLIHRVKTELMRWRCAACGLTFRHFPPGVMPRKQYLPSSLLELCQRYVQEELATYRQVANCGGPLKKQPLFYAAVAAEKESSERQKALETPHVLSHATLWQWIGFLAALGVLGRKRAERMQSATGHVELSPWNIHPHKYRSEKRRQILVFAAQALAVFSAEKYPTNFETLYGGP